MCRTGNDINNVFDIITLKYWYCILNCTSVQHVEQATLQEDEVYVNVLFLGCEF